MFVRVRVPQTVPLPGINLKRNMNINMGSHSTPLARVSPVIDKVCRA